MRNLADKSWIQARARQQARYGATMLTIAGVLFTLPIVALTIALIGA